MRRRHYLVEKKPGRRRFRVMMRVNTTPEYSVVIDSFFSPKQAERLRKHLENAYNEGVQDTKEANNG